MNSGNIRIMRVPATSHDKARESFLVKLFRERGYTRAPDQRRRRKENQRYKKGYEVRLPVRTKEELRRVRQLLRKAGLKPGKPYNHHSYLVQPVYGKKAVEWFHSQRSRTH